MVYKYFREVKINKDLSYEIKEEKIISSSLRDSLYPVEIELNRYQMTLDKMREQDSTCSMLFEVLMESETE